MAGKKRREQQREGGHVRGLLRWPDHGARASPPAPGPSGHQRTGLTGGSVDERRRPPLRRVARKLRLRIRGDGTGRQEFEYSFRLRNLRHISVVSGSRSALQYQCKISARNDSVLDFNGGARGLRRVLEKGS